MAALAYEGFAANKVFLLAPFGGEATFRKVEKKLDIPADLLRANVSTIIAKGVEPIDWFPAANLIVGEKEEGGSTGHIGRKFMRDFNNKLNQ